LSDHDQVVLPCRWYVTRAEVERVVEGAPNRVRRNGAPLVADVLVVTPSRVTTKFTALTTAVDW
jgi:hypothetical protein